MSRLFCPYVSDYCIHSKLENVDCSKCIWSAYGHNADDFFNDEDDNSLLFTSISDFSPLEESEIPF